MKWSYRSLLQAAALAVAVAVGAAQPLPAAAATGAAMPSLVTPAWLREHLKDGNLKVLSVYLKKNQRPAFEKAHIPGAVFTAFHDDGWRVNRHGVTGVLPAPARVAALIGKLGISDANDVVVVPGGPEKGDFNATSRVYWTLKILGVANAAILNGGDHAWLADSANPVASGASTPKAVTFKTHWRTGMLATLDMVKADLRTHASQLVDARPPAQFDGKAKSGVVLKAGTIPGSLNLPAVALLTKDHEGLLPHEELVAALKKAGVKADQPSIVFCNTGHLASGVWFVLREAFQNPKVVLYDASMSEWTRHPNLPVVAGKSMF